MVSGDIEAATADFSSELRRNLGEVIALLPLPVTDATSIRSSAAAAAYVAILQLVGESETVQVQTRWKDRDGRPTVIEASHLSRVETALPSADGEVDVDGVESDTASA